MQIIKIEMAESSNNEAAILSKKQDLNEGTIVWVLNQTQGRGQGTKKWYSKPNENLTFSVIYKPIFLPIEKQFMLSKMVAVAVCKVVSCFCEDAFIKWPNDIYVKNKKVAGILIENSIKGNTMQTSIIGIGVNVNQVNFPTDLPNPTSLCLESSLKYDLEQLIQLFQESVNEEYKKLRSGQYASIEADYDRKLYKKNQNVRIIYQNKETTAKLILVDSSGFIHFMTEDKELIFSVGEIEFVIDESIGDFLIYI